MSKMKLAPLSRAIIARRWSWTSAFGAFGALVPGLALAAPTGGNVVAGSASINAPNGTTTVVNQASGSAVIQWQTFNVGSNEYVIFNQPNASAAVLNRVTGGSASEILGHLQSNGRVFIINPQGVLFGQGAQVNVGSLVASTMDISNSDFMQGKYTLKNGGSGDVVNSGHITTADGGFVVLAGDSVKNEGVIAARLGDVVLASGNAVTLDLDGNGLINFTVDEASLAARAGVSNVGEIIAQGGSVVMSARTARDLLHSAVNNSGVIRASGISEKGGDIYLTAEGGSITNSGTLDASGSNGFDAGSILIHSDADVTLAQGSVIDITGKNGGSAHVISGGLLTTAAGSAIDGVSDQNAGKGGSLELSGKDVDLKGGIALGKGGSLLLDPDNLCVTAGTGQNCTSTGDTSGLNIVSQKTIEGLLNSGTSVSLVAGDNILVDAGLDNNAISSNYAGAGLLMGIGYGGYSGSAYGYGPNNGSFSRGQSFYGGSIIFAGDAYGNNRGGVNIAGDFQAYSATNQGSITIGDIHARDVYVRAFGGISLGDIVSTASSVVGYGGYGNYGGGNVDINGGMPGYGTVSTGSVTAIGLAGYGGAISLVSGSEIIVSGDVHANLQDILIQSDSNMSINGDVTADNGSIHLRFGGSDTPSTVGNLTASGYGNYGAQGSICINDVSCDNGYANFYGASGATLLLGSGTTTWNGAAVEVGNVAIEGSLDNSDAKASTLKILTNSAAGAGGYIVFHNGSSASALKELDLITDPTAVAGATVSGGGTIDLGVFLDPTGVSLNADTLDIETGSFGSSGNLGYGHLSGKVGIIKLTSSDSQSFNEISNSTLDFDTSLTITQSAGSLNIFNTDFNSGLDFASVADITAHDVSITSGRIGVSGADGLLQAGKLQLTATDDNVQINQGAVLNFREGTLSAPLFTPTVQTTALTQTEQPPVSNTEDTSGVGIGDYYSGYGGMTSDTAKLTYNKLAITGQNTYIYQATLQGDGAGNQLNINTDSTTIQQNSHLSGLAASITSSAAKTIVLGSSTGLSLTDSQLDYSGAFSASTNHNIDIRNLEFNSNAYGNLPDSSFTLSAPTIYVGGSSIYADHITIGSAGATDSYGSNSATLDDSSLEYRIGVFGSGTLQQSLSIVDNSSLTASGTGASTSIAAAGTISIGGSSINGGDSITITQTGDSSGYGSVSISDSTLGLITGDLKILAKNSIYLNGDLLHAANITIQSDAWIDMFNSTAYGGNLTIKALGDDGYGMSATFIDNQVDMDGDLSISGAKSVQFYSDNTGVVTLAATDCTVDCTPVITNPVLSGPNSYNAHTITVTAGGALAMDDVSFSGVTGTFSAAGLYLPGLRSLSPGDPVYGGESISSTDSSFTFNDELGGEDELITAGSVHFNGARSIFMQGVDVSASNVALHAGDDAVLTDSSFYGGTSLVLTAGVGTELGTAFNPDASLSIDGEFDGGQVIMAASNAVQEYNSENSIDINAGALDVAAHDIYLDDSTINIYGDGLVAHGGHDDRLIAAMANADDTFPRPASPAPNASFVAVGDVYLGTVNFNNGADYLFIQGFDPRVGALNFSTLQPLALTDGYGGGPSTAPFVNYVPSDLNQDLILADIGEGDFLSSIAGSGATVAIGGSSYRGNIAVTTPVAPTDMQTLALTSPITYSNNFVFGSAGQINGVDDFTTPDGSFTTSGRVLVLHFGDDGVNQAINSINHKDQESLDQESHDAAHTGDGLIEIQDDKGEGNEFECT